MRKREPLEILSYGNLRIKIYEDFMAHNPRDDKKVIGRLVFWHNKWTDLGDLHAFKDYSAFWDFVSLHKSIVLPVYLNDDIGVTITTKPPKESSHLYSQLGFIYVKYESLRAYFRKERIGCKLQEQAKKILEKEVFDYNNYINGQNYGFTIEDLDGNEIISQFGFLGSISKPIETAKQLIRYGVHKKPSKYHSNGGSLSC